MLNNVNSMNVNKLNELIQARKITKAKLITEARISRPALDSILSGRDCRVSNLEKIANALRVPVSVFFDEPDEIGVINLAGKHNQLNQEGAHDNINAADSEVAILHERLKLLQSLVQEKDARILELKERIEEIKAFSTADKAE